jgi:hypothetical protein
MNGDTTPRKWARGNKDLFPHHNFTDKQNNHPTTDEIVIFLENNFSFKTVSDNAIAIHYNINENLNI